MDWERTLASVFFLSYLVALGYFSSRMAGKIAAIYARYGIRRQDSFNPQTRFREIIGEQDWMELRRFERRYRRFLIFGILLLIVVTATYGLTKAAVTGE